MNRLLVSMFFLWISCSFQQKGKMMKFTPFPALYRMDNYLDVRYNESFFLEEHFGYANAIKDDTSKHFYTSETVILEDTTKYFLRNCIAKLVGSHLLLQFTDTPFSVSPYELRILKEKNQFTAEYYQTFSVADSSYKPPIFKIVRQNIILDKESYLKGDSIKGKLSLEVLASHFWEYKYTDTVHIYGLLKTIVE